jgi:crotonobetainyl-CoA:carnitine CoA-transferase CaiB-like acyl-CoA transferase
MVSDLLKGVRVLDLTTILAGPFAAYQLSLFGADVTKLEIPGTGDLAREIGDDPTLTDAAMGASFLAQNAGKRSMTINLKNAIGREVFERLLVASDVLLENMRPGVLERLGYPWERIHEVNPRLIYCAVSGFGQTGPLAGRPAYDQIIQGLAGMSDVTGLPSSGPLRVGFPVCDTLGGFAAAMAICAALTRRAHDDVGCFLDVSMLGLGRLRTPHRGTDRRTIWQRQRGLVAVGDVSYR